MPAQPDAAAGPQVSARPDQGSEDAADRATATREAVRLLGLLAQPDRLRVAAALVLGATSAPEVAAATGMTARAAAQALTRLATGGLAESTGSRWELRADRLEEAVRVAAPDADSDDHGAADPGTAAVLRNFLRNGRYLVDEEFLDRGNGVYWRTGGTVELGADAEL